MKKIHLVTGGSGFLGHLIARRLLEQGERVRVLDIWDSPDRPHDIEYVDCDVLNRDGVARAMQDVSIVHHNAALVPITKANARYAAINRDGSRIVAEEATRAGVDAFIYMSSSSIFQTPPPDARHPITNATPLQPIETYGKAKLAGEQVVRQVCEQQQIPLIAIRPRTILGDGRLGIFQILFEWISESRKIYLIGKGDNLFQFIHAHDLMDFYMLALRAEKAGDYNVGAAEFATLREDLSYLIQQVGSSSRIVGLPVTPAIVALRALDTLGLSPLTKWHYETYHLPYYFDIEPLLALGWQPRYSNKTMFIESYRWFEENRDRLAIEKNTSAHRRPVQQGLLALLRRLS